MPPLSAKRRADLPDSAFAYVDSRGRRRLPINDEPHVRNALARFGQVAFESEAAMARARTRLLKAAKRYGIVPIGFMDGQLRAQRPRDLPTGTVTFLLTDVEDSTGLLRRLDDRYAGLIDELRGLMRAAVRRSRGREVDVRADEFFAAFARPAAALEAALAIQRGLAGRAWPHDVGVRVRIGIHTGTPTLTETGYVGLAVNTVARVSFAGHGGQILISGEGRRALDGAEPGGVSFADLGSHELQGLPEPVSLYEVRAAGLPSGFPPPRIGAAAAQPR